MAWGTHDRELPLGSTRESRREGTPASHATNHWGGREGAKSLTLAPSLSRPAGRWTPPPCPMPTSSSQYLVKNTES